MKTIKLKDNFNMYHFEPYEDRPIGQNVYVLYHDKECLILDAGYEWHIKQIKPHLKGYEIKHVICTHFHPDHCYGLNELGKQHLIGSHKAIETLEMFEDADNELLIPDVMIEDEYVIDFHGHTIKLKVNPGHSNCEMLIDVDGEFLLVGDEYMTTNDDTPVLPYVAETIEQHISSLEYIRDNYEGYTFLPSHGVHTKDIRKIDYRIRYLNFALTGNQSMDDFYLNTDEKFSNIKWHRINVKKKNRKKNT